MKNKIIAVDFDGTLCENKWPDIGAPNWELISYIKEQKASGAKIILWTCRTNKLLCDALHWCEDVHGLEFDSVNKNVQEIITCYGEDGRKIYADEYIDDKACTRFELPFRIEETNRTDTPKDKIYSGKPIGTVLRKDDNAITIQLTDEAKQDPRIMEFFGFNRIASMSFEVKG